MPELMDMDVAGLSERPITGFLPRLLKVSVGLGSLSFYLQCRNDDDGTVPIGHCQVLD